MDPAKQGIDFVQHALDAQNRSFFKLCAPSTVCPHKFPLAGPKLFPRRELGGPRSAPAARTENPVWNAE